jgi:diadenosine tetraphosphate (Ap4A) HIT family hydrolase
MTNNCLFCSMAPTRIITQNDTAYTVYDGNLVTELHTLVIHKDMRLIMDN